MSEHFSLKRSLYCSLFLVLWSLEEQTTKRLQCQHLPTNTTNGCQTGRTLNTHPGTLTEGIKVQFDFNIDRKLYSKVLRARNEETTCTFTENHPDFEREEDRRYWEEEQKRIDREWYSIDEGYDETNNPFAGTSDEYTKKKEQQLEENKKKKMSARQRQTHKVGCCIIMKVIRCQVGETTCLLLSPLPYHFNRTMKCGS